MRLIQRTAALLTAVLIISSVQLTVSADEERIKLSSDRIDLGSVPVGFGPDDEVRGEVTVINEGDEDIKVEVVLPEDGPFGISDTELEIKAHESSELVIRSDSSLTEYIGVAKTYEGIYILNLISGSEIIESKEITVTLKVGDLIADPTLAPTLEPTATVTVEPTATATPEPTATATPTPTEIPRATPTSVPGRDRKADVRDFVNRIYTFILDREPEQAGADYWTEELWNFRMTAADAAMGFLFSPEFDSKNVSNGRFVDILYRTFFDRIPDTSGKANWVRQLDNGVLTRAECARRFIDTQEWADSCARFGIGSGSTVKANIRIKPTNETYQFVERLYETALGRKYDEGGRDGWADVLANYDMSGGHVAVFFFSSDEMNSQKLSNEEFLTRLYNTFLNRDPDEEGRLFWHRYLSDHRRSEAVQEFASSEEFATRCTKARIQP